jgi:hypothetical protein
VDANTLKKDRKFPHLYNIIGWRRWLKKNRIGEIHFYQPDKSFFPLLTALRLLPLDITVHLTGYTERTILRMLSWLAPRWVQFRCAGKFLAEQLKQAGIPTNRITVDIPVPEIASVSQVAHDAIRRQIQSDCNTDSDSILLLALAEPDNVQGLYTICWATAILYHLSQNVRLVIAGPCTGTDERRFESWQQMWKVKNVIYFDKGRDDWDGLVAASDIVLVGNKNLKEVIRLVHVYAAGKIIVAHSGDGNEFLTGTGQARIVSSSDARSFARAILSV